MSIRPGRRLVDSSYRTSRAGRAGRRWQVVLVAGLLVIALGTGALWTNAFGAKDRFDGLVARIELLIDPPPDRPTLPTVTVTPRPSTAPTASPRPSRPAGSAPVPASSPTPAPTPVRTPVDVDILQNPGAFFATQVDPEWCASAGTQMVLAIHGLSDASAETQRRIQGRVDEWEAWEDSHNGKWGPAAMALALDAFGVPGYEVRAYETRDDAVRGAAAAIEETGAPVILLTWRGAHTWVMTGYRADADPTIFPDAVVSGAYILDPWYPRVSSIWGPSDPAGTFQDQAEMERNYLPWKRPEGAYPDRDGKFILVAPTLPLTSPG